MSSYSVFAKYYDDLTANIDYKKRGEYFHEIIKKYNKTDNNILLDLGCGTGSRMLSISSIMALGNPPAQLTLRFQPALLKED